MPVKTLWYLQFLRTFRVLLQWRDDGPEIEQKVVAM
jgi:hypothetical protein